MSESRGVPSHDAAELALRLRQQELIAGFGLLALRELDQRRLLDEVCRLAAEGMGSRFAKVLEYDATRGDFLLCAGIGWRPGVVGHARIEAGTGSAAGFALTSGQPVLSNELASESRFRTPALLREHGIARALNVVLRGEGPAWGVLEVDRADGGTFAERDIAFLQALANTVSVARERAEGRAALLEAGAAKDALLREKDLLMQEVHHRVRNSLQLVQTLLSLQARGQDAALADHLREAATRVRTIAAVHGRLYQGGSVTESDAALYVAGLIADLRTSLADAVTDRDVVLDSPAMVLPADRLTPLGLVTTELVTNALKYGAGRVLVRLEPVGDVLVVTVEDQGPGFPPDFDPQAGRGLGMRLVTAMARGGDDTVTIDRSVPHARIHVRLPLQG
jgi:two-component sensor histidine kinase